MSLHPSLVPKGKGKRRHSVMKRYERIKEMLEKEKWKPGDSVYGLAKLKVMRWKAKKVKKAAEAAGAEGTAPEAGAAAKPAAGKPAAATEKKEAVKK
ncbi:MAG: small basic protein [Candidatus Omnitrophota bacterium]